MFSSWPACVGAVFLLGSPESSGLWFSQAEFRWGPWSVFSFVSKHRMISCTYPFFLCLAWFPWKCRLWKQQSLAPQAQTPCAILGISKVNTTQHVGVNRSGQGRQGCRRKVWYPIVLLEKECTFTGLQFICSIRNIRFILVNINLDREEKYKIGHTLPFKIKWIWKTKKLLLKKRDTWNNLIVLYNEKIILHFCELQADSYNLF